MTSSTQPPLVVFSLDGLARESLGPYGCRWNETPAIDAIAATGLVLDRCVLDNDSDVVQMDRFWSAKDIAAYAARGETVLVTDDEAVEEQGVPFDRVIFVEPSIAPESETKSTASESAVNSNNSGSEAEAIEDTRFGKICMAAVQADLVNPGTISLLWIHSRFLRDRWDAPSSLSVGGWNLQTVDEASSENDLETNDLEPSDLEPNADDHHPMAVPSMTIQPGDDPDLAGDWAARYATQVRLVDVLLEITLASLSIHDPMVMIVSTGGFSLGQNSEIGYRRGAIRSCQIHIPLIISDAGSRRSRSLVTPRDAMEHWMADPNQRHSIQTPAGEQHTAPEPMQPREILRTKTDRADDVITTPQWFAVLGPNDAESLFVKPDDVHDANDVARRRLDVIDELKNEA